MQGGHRTSFWSVGFVVGAALGLAACAHHRGDDEDVNAYPANYKADILAAMHVYLNDPTGIRDAAIAEPVLKSTGTGMDAPTRYLVCVRFNPKRSATVYDGVRDVAAVFLAGRFDRFIDTPKQQCADAAYAAFPELQKLSR
jgi:hypothetical protein